MNDILWQPSAEQVAGTQMRQFAESAGFTGEEAENRLWQWSIDHPAAFWEAIWTTMDVRASAARGRGAGNPDAMPWLGHPTPA